MSVIYFIRQVFEILSSVISGVVRFVVSSIGRSVSCGYIQVLVMLMIDLFLSVDDVQGLYMSIMLFMGWFGQIQFSYVVIRCIMRKVYYSVSIWSVEVWVMLGGL